MKPFILLPDKPPPTSEISAFAWMKKNLFSSWLNILLSLFAIYLLYLVLPSFINWAFIEATWDGATREDCNPQGACWLFIKVKFHQFMYGFYPTDQAWRLVIALLIFVFSFIPFFIKSKSMIFRKTKKLLSIFLIFCYPFILFWLIYGGFGLIEIDNEKWGGLMLTLVFAYVGIIVSFPFSIFLAMGRASTLPFIQAISIIFIEAWRGVPLITILFSVSNILPLFFPEGIEFNKLLRALIGVVFFQSAYMAEVIRGGLQAIPKGQHEAAAALGLNYWQKTRLILLPQALRIVIPNIVGVSIALLKDSTLILIIGLFDVLAIVNLANADTKWIGFETEGYIFVGLLFWICCSLLSRYSIVLEKKFSIKHK